MSGISSHRCSSLRQTVFAMVAAASFVAPTCRAAGSPNVVTVGTPLELAAAVADANRHGGGVQIRLKDGTYHLDHGLYIKAPDVTIIGASGDRDRVLIQGDGMRKDARVRELIHTAGARFRLEAVTLQYAGTHLLQIAGEADADDVVVRNVVFRDSWEQMLKASADPQRPSLSADRAVIEDSLFEYTAGIGPQYYIGGIDVHAGQNWVVRNNVFREILSPSNEVAEFAIHFWVNSVNPTVERNQIIDCDRGVGFGLSKRGNTGGVIRENVIVSTAMRSVTQDTGIYLDNSPGTRVEGNLIYFNHAYPYSIEYRYRETSDVLIVNNLVNRPILPRDGALDAAHANRVEAEASTFRVRAMELGAKEAFIWRR